MSKTTLAIIAAASAATGASLTALIYSSRVKQQSASPSPIAPPVASRVTPSTQLQVSPPIAVAAAKTLVNPEGISQYCNFGAVADTLITPSHISSFNRFTRNPHAVAEHFTRKSLAINDASRRHSTFYEDHEIPHMFRARLADYARSGYDRGHQTPAADCKWSQEAMDSTFALSNMCPQVGEGFNRDYWAHFEEFCRDLVNRYPSVRVVTGPLYLPKKDEDGKWKVSYEVIGHPPNVAVPTHFYKVIYGEELEDSPIGRVALGAFVLPNAEIPTYKSLADFEVPLEAVERASGLTFADKLPSNRRRRLCEEVRCETVVRDFNKAKQQVNGSQKNTGQLAQPSRR